MQISIPVPPAFNFKRTAMSHGWRTLLPFESDEAGSRITRVLALDGEDSPPVTVHITSLEDALRIEIARRKLG